MTFHPGYSASFASAVATFCAVALIFNAPADAQEPGDNHSAIKSGIID